MRPSFVQLHLPNTGALGPLMIAALSWVSIACLIGCRANAAARDDEEIDRADDAPPLQWEIARPAPTTARVEERPLAVEARPTLLKRGEPPLVYLLTSPARIAIVDLSTESRLASADAPGNTIIRVDPRRGILFGEDLLVAGPLPADRSYGIYLEPSEQSTLQTKTITPSDAPPTIAPADEQPPADASPPRERG